MAVLSGGWVESALNIGRGGRARSERMVCLVWGDPNVVDMYLVDTDAPPPVVLGGGGGTGMADDLIDRLELPRGGGGSVIALRGALTMVREIGRDDIDRESERFLPAGSPALTRARVESSEGVNVNAQEQTGRLRVVLEKPESMECSRSRSSCSSISWSSMVAEYVHM